MNGTGAATGEADQLGALKPPLRLPEEQPEHPLLDGREKRRHDGTGAFGDTVPISGTIVPD